MSYLSATCRTAIVTASLLCAPVVHAAEGQLEINQACAVNTGCFPGDTPGFPVTIVQPGSYRLTGNLDLGDVDSVLHGIEVRTPAVTVDLGGFHIAGPTTCTGSGTWISCSPSGVGSGVRFTINATASVVQNGIVRNMAGPGILIQAAGSRVQNITAAHNAFHGILAQEAALVLNSVAVENGGDGIDVTSGSMLDGVSSIGNGRNGIHDESFSGGSVVTKTVARNNGERGFLLSGFSRYGSNNVSSDNASADRCGGGLCSERRRLYRTRISYNGANVLQACSSTPGFHVASRNELLDISRYIYDTVLGPTYTGTGVAVPAGAGWVLSGTVSHALINCSGYTSDAGADLGSYLTVLPLPPPPATFSSLDEFIVAGTTSCSALRPVWCLQDD